MKKVIVALSGGVDSAVAALLLKQAGYDLIGVTALNWPDSRCCHDSAILQAQKLAWQLKIPHHVIDVSFDFQKEIIDHFVGSYEKGLTPSPCTRCNQKIRFDLLPLSLQKKLGIEECFFSTGHYVRVEHQKEFSYLRKGVDASKDQSYMLYALSQAQIKNYIAPLGSMTKKDVRALAQQHQLEAASNPDSQDICFVGSRYQTFLEEYTGKSYPHGNFVDQAGNILGQHTGIPFYTVGQRRGLNLAMGEPYYVIKIHAEKNEIVVGQITECSQQEFLVHDCNWQLNNIPDSLEADVKIRYRTEAQHAYIQKTKDYTYLVQLTHSMESITPGQAAVFYDQDRVLGGGIISSNTL